MRKKLLICLCTFVMALGMTACGSSDEEGKVGGVEIDAYRANLQQMMWNVSASNEDSIDYVIENPQTEVVGGLFENYKECYDEENTLVQFYSDNTIIGGINIGNYNFGGTRAFDVSKSGKTITATLIGDFSKRDLKLTYVFNAYDVEAGPTAMNIEPVYTLGETMQKAGLNTVMGILIVFCMLVVMSGVIKCFEIIPKIEKKLKESKEAEEAKPVAAVAAPVASAKNETDDLQLVAVIAAAIAASTGASTDSFVVRSIKKR